MSCATAAITTLKRGEPARIRPRGHSMKGKINDRDFVTGAPCDPAALVVGDIVLVRVHGHDYLHLIKATDRDRFLIGNNRGGMNGWVGPDAIHGVATRVETSRGGRNLR